MKNFAIYESILGYIRIDYWENAVIALQKINLEPDDFGRKTAFSDEVFQEITEYLAGKRKTFDLNLNLQGTDFQKKVWQELLKIPYGETRSYKEIAIAIGNEKASRAVGMANNKNPIVIAVPCHRVIGANGKLVGYAGGLAMKEYLLKLENGTLED